MVQNQEAVAVQPTDADIEMDKLLAMTDAERMKAIEEIVKTGDYKAVAALSRKFDTVDKAKEKAELDAKRQALDAMKGKVEAAISKAIKPIVDAGGLDAADGIWYSYDFGEEAPVVRLMKSAPKANRSTGGGGGKKFDISTEDMLSRHGSEEYKDGINFQQAWESSTDKNWRYAIRTKLLKLEGIL